MNKIIVIAVITLLNLSQVMAQAIDHTFNYQGELLISGNPANGSYDIKIEGFDGVGVSKTDVSEHLNVQASDGLFAIEGVDLGVANLDAFTTLLQISVRENAVGGAYTDLSPRQSLKSVPYASKVIDVNATNGQIYTYGTLTGWAAADPVDLSPWANAGTHIQHAGNVTIGSDPAGATHKLTVKADGNDKALRILGSQEPFIYVGGKINFGDVNFVQIEEDTDDHLKIYARLGIEFASDTTQPLTMNGQIKFMIQANCAPASSISKQYNGTGSGNATITNGALSGLCKVTFPFDLSNRFYQVSSVEDLIATNATCQESGSDLNCARHRSSTGALEPGQIMILVY